MKTIVIYYSYTQNNEKLARFIQNKLKCDILKIEEFKKRTWLTIFLDLLFKRLPSIKTAPCSLSSYDHVVFIAPIWAAKLASPLETFIRSERSSVKSYSFISLCGGAKGQLAKITSQLKDILMKDPEAVADLSVLDVVPEGKSPANYRLSENDIQIYSERISDFLTQLQASFAPTGAG
jgi:menaquinone-dependent protoporphyrinogen IX oxidase